MKEFKAYKRWLESQLRHEETDFRLQTKLASTVVSLLLMNYSDPRIVDPDQSVPHLTDGDLRKLKAMFFPLTKKPGARELSGLHL